jgi:hypothetical protein
MLPKHRVLAAFRHEEPDRVPLDYSANPEIDERLKRHYGLAKDDSEGLRQALGVDFRSVAAPYVGPKLHPDLPDRRVDNWGIRRRWIEHTAGGYWEYCDWPLKNAALDEVLAWPLPDPDDFDYGRLPRECARNRDYCVCLGGAGVPDIINGTAMLRTMEQVLVDLVTDDAAGLALIDRRVEVHAEIIRRSLEAADGGVDLLCLGDDLGTQIGPMISLALYRKHLRPRHQRFADLAKRWGIPAMIHSCGSSSWAFDDFLQMGIGAVDTLQPEAKDMAPAYLKERWGERLAFHGMISTAGPLAYGSAADVVRTVRQTLRIMMPGGGYCLAPTHAIQSNSPTENVVAMYEAGREYGMYE